jgi:hypothetical protein
MLSSSANKDSLADLWSDFLEREAGEGGRERTGSVASQATQGSVVSPVERTERRGTPSGLGIMGDKD